MSREEAANCVFHFLTCPLSLDEILLPPISVFRVLDDAGCAFFILLTLPDVVEASARGIESPAGVEFAYLRLFCPWKSSRNICRRSIPFQKDTNALSTLLLQFNIFKQQNYYD